MKLILLIIFMQLNKEFYENICKINNRYSKNIKKAVKYQA